MSHERMGVTASAASVAAAVLLAVSGAAHADIGADIGYRVGRYNNELQGNALVGEVPEPKDCFGAVEAGKKAGLKDTDLLTDPAFRGHPKAIMKEPDSWTKTFHLAFGDAAGVCEQYEARYSLRPVEKMLKRAADDEDYRLDPNPQTWKGMGEDNGVYGMNDAKACVKAIDAAMAAGKGETRLPLKPELSLAEIKAQICEPGIAYFAKVDKLLKGAKDAAVSATAEKYKKVGIKGDRLKLFVEYDNIYWYKKGCESKTDDPAELKKAKALFQWLENADGTHTIRKFTFKGDKYKVSEKTYSTMARAYKGCK
jgi:hypothetical protein